MTDLRLYNTLTGQEEPFQPLDPAGKKVKLYVCGPTVYDEAHLGHARCYITWDVLYRFLKFLGYDVAYARNVTDVDDKILKKADELGVTPDDVAKKYYASFIADMDALNVLRPDIEPRATEYIAKMIEAIQDLIQKNAAYVTPEGTVYYRVSSKADYGKLSKKPLDDLKAGARVEVDPHKESPLDFALWKHVSVEEQSKPGHAFDSPWGRGRPGWHIECSAMNAAVFGEQIDIHAGGADLIFPHHENEIAQSESWTGHAPFAQYWLHNGFVNVSGEKMSKSLGNFSTIQKVLARYDANTIRYFLLTNGYRMPVDFNDDALEGAKNWVKRTFTNSLKNSFVFERQKQHSLSVEDLLIDPKDKDMTQFRDIMSFDLNTAKALDYLNQEISLMRQLRNQITHGLPLEGDQAQRYFQQHFLTLAVVMTISHALGFNLSFLTEKIQLPIEALRTIYNELTGEWLSEDQAPEVWLEKILEMRKAAKAAKNWTQADAIRKHLSDIGIQIMDNKDGTTTWELKQ